MQAQASNDRRNSQIDAALSEAQEAFTAANPASRARFEEALPFMPGGNTRTNAYFAPFPIAFAGGSGGRLTDMDGHSYVDLLGDYSAGLYGHSDPVISQALKQAIDNGLSLGSNHMEQRFAGALCGRFGLERVRLTNSGTEANLLAIAAARAFTGRPKILAMVDGYHGSVFGFTKSNLKVNMPIEVVLAPFNDIEGTSALIEENASDIAAIILEPVMGGGGCIPADVDYLRMLREAATKIGAVLIFDEVMTSRLSPGGRQAMVGVKPDLTTLGKYLGGGPSFGAFGGTAAIMEIFDPRSPQALPHGGTFNNNILTMTAGYTGLTQVYTPAAVAYLNGRGDRLREDMNKLFQSSGVKMQATGVGSMIGIHPHTDPIRRPADAQRSDQRVKDLLFFDMMRAGIWLAKRGMITLSLPITDADCIQFLSTLEEFVSVRGELLR